jgi:signal transduction histidine kinase
MTPMTATATAEASPDRGAALPEVDEIVYRISHDLRASVRALRELPEWLREDLQEMNIEIAGESDRTLSLIASHARRLDEMLNGLLTFSRVGRLQERIRIQPQNVFEQVLAELDVGPDMKFFTQFNTAEVTMGGADIARVFHVLLSNAIIHSRRDDAQIELTSCRSGDHWELLVSDNGPGIPDADKERVFRPMTKLVSRDEDEGGGMGLAILAKIVEHYGGTVHVEDRIRRGGCTFRVRLPVLVGR